MRRTGRRLPQHTTTSDPGQVPAPSAASPSDHRPRATGQGRVPHPVIAAQAAIRPATAIARPPPAQPDWGRHGSSRRGATCCARPPTVRGDRLGSHPDRVCRARPPTVRGDHSGANPTPPLQMLERGPGGEASPRLQPSSSSPHPLNLDSDKENRQGRCLSPTPANVYSLTGIGSCKPLLEHRATARQESTRTIVSTYAGGTATQPRAPGHERPFAALRAAKHGRLSAASTAPGADIPRAPSARAPGQYCQSAALRAPGHGSPLATTAGVLCHGRLSAALLAPGEDSPPATTAGAPSQHRPSAAPIATVSLPAGQHRLRQEGLPYTPANPRTLTHPQAHQDTAHTRTKSTDALPSPRIAGGLQGGQPFLPSPNVGEGPGVRPTTHQAHPAIQVPPHPRPCSTADTGFSFNHPSRAPPLPAHQWVSPPSPTIPRTPARAL